MSSSEESYASTLIAAIVLPRRSLGPYRSGSAPAGDVDAGPCAHRDRSGDTGAEGDRRGVEEAGRQAGDPPPAPRAEGRQPLGPGQAVVQFLRAFPELD